MKGTRFSSRRFVLLGGPGGYMTVVPAGHPMREDRYWNWTELLRVNVPRSRVGCASCVDEHPPFVMFDAMKKWALDVYGNAA